MNVLKEFPADEVLPLVHKQPCFQYQGLTYGFSVRMQLFSKNPSCVVCGIKGTVVRLESHKQEKAHLNLYAINNGKFVLMTKDHIKARSKGGKNSHRNYQTMCVVCNNLKANYDLSIEEVRDLRKNGSVHLSNSNVLNRLDEVLKFVKIDHIKTRRLSLIACEEAVNKSTKPLCTTTKLNVFLHKTGELVADTKDGDIILTLEKGYELHPIGCNGHNIYVKLKGSKFCSINHRYLEVA